MTDTPENDPAFPTAVLNGEAYSGMTLRDYFAAAALQGCLANADLIQKIGASPVDLSSIAFEFSDAMLKARKGNPNG